MSDRIELNNSETKLSLTHEELRQIFEDMGIVIEDPKQKFQLEFSPASGGKIMTDFFGENDLLGIAYRLAEITVTDLDEDPESPPDVTPEEPPTNSCVSCLPDTLDITISGGCGEFTGTLTSSSEDDPAGTYNKTWRSEAIASEGESSGCPAAWYIELVCVSYDEDTSEAVFEVRSKDSSFAATKQFVSKTVTFPCDSTGSIDFAFTGTIYSGYLDRKSVV